MDAIERIEISIRTLTVNSFVNRYGPFGHLYEINLPKLKVGEFLEWRVSLQEETRRSKEIFKRHFFEKYKAHQNLPLWMAAELMSMGSLLTFFKGVEPEIKREVAGVFRLPDEVMMSWFRSLNAARNICAHHSRFWNRELGYPPQLPKKNLDWQEENRLKQNRCGVILMICRYLLRRITPTSKWYCRMEELFDEYSEIPLEEMGLPLNWKRHPIWTDSR